MNTEQESLLSVTLTHSLLHAGAPIPFSPAPFRASGEADLPGRSSLLVSEVKWSKGTQTEPPYQGDAPSSKIPEWFRLSLAEMKMWHACICKSASSFQLPKQVYTRVQTDLVHANVMCLQRHKSERLEFKKLLVHFSDPNNGRPYLKFCLAELIQEYRKDFNLVQVKN